jgi:hypothetical protein
MFSWCHGHIVKGRGHMCACVHGFGDPGPRAIQLWQDYWKGKVLLEVMGDGQGTLWIYSWNCCSEQAVLACFFFIIRLCLWSILWKDRFSCMAVSCLCSNNSLRIVEYSFLSCGSLLILHFMILFFPVMKTVPARTNQRFTWLQKLRCRKSHVIAPTDVWNNYTNISKIVWLQVNIILKAACL